MKSIIMFLLTLVFSLLFFACGRSSKEKSNNNIYQSQRSNIVNVAKQIKNINSPHNLAIGRSKIYITNKYLLALDLQAFDKGIHVFDKKTLKYITSFAQKGRGPKEIVRFGDLAISTNKEKIYVSDYGKMKTFLFDLDSAIVDPNYEPRVTFSLNKKFFPTTYEFINDSIIIGNSINVLDHTTYEAAIVKHNINSEQSSIIDKHHQDIDKINLTPYFSLSIRNGICVVAYPKNDLIRILDFEGNVIRNIYGPLWTKEKNNHEYFYVTKIGGNKIWASYIGGPPAILDEYQRPKGVSPNNIMVFSKNGEYEKTIDAGHGILDFCFDNEYNRLIFYLDDQEEPLHYLELNKLGS